MQIQVDIEFAQLLKMVKDLSPGKLKQLKAEINKEEKDVKSYCEIENLLLNGPVATKRQIEAIENNRKAINSTLTD